MRPKLTRTYELPVPSGVTVSYKEGDTRISISNGITYIWLNLGFIPDLADALKAIRMVKAKEEVDGIATDD